MGDIWDKIWIQIFLSKQNITPPIPSLPALFEVKWSFPNKEFDFFLILNVNTGQQTVRESRPLFGNNFLQKLKNSTKKLYFIFFFLRNRENREKGKTRKICM